MPQDPVVPLIFTASDSGASLVLELSLFNTVRSLPAESPVLFPQEVRQEISNRAHIITVAFIFIFRSPVFSLLYDDWSKGYNHRIAHRQSEGQIPVDSGIILYDKGNIPHPQESFWWESEFMSIYKQIKNKFIMKNAREDWTAYRVHFTDLVVRLLSEMQSQMSGDPASGSVMLIGAGRCNDIELRTLAISAENVILLDVDKDAMREAAFGLPDELRQKVECREASVTGITEADLDAFCNDLLSFVRSAGKDLTMERLRSQLNAGLDVLDDKLFRKEDELFGILPEASADILVCNGVFSQFFSMLSFFIRSLFYSLQEILPDVGSLENEVNKRIRGMNDHIIPIINRAFCTVARKGIVLGNEYMPDRPVEGAYRCIEYVRNNLRPVELHLAWDFNCEEGITYDMLIQICRF